MERREVLKGGVAGLAAIAGTGCAGQVGGRRDLALASLGSLPDVSRPLANLDLGLSRLQSWTPVAAGTPVAAADAELARTSLGVLYLHGLFRDLAEEERAHPEVQERMWGSVPAMDQAVLGMASLLHAHAPEASQIQRVLRERPALIDDLGEQLDREAGAAGVSLERRVHLRKLVKQVAFRMQNQPPEMLFADYVQKADKAVAYHGATEPALGRFESEVRGGALQEHSQPAASQPAAPAEPETGSHRALTAGGVLLGLGVVGAVVGMANTSVIVLATVGVLLIIAGLITLLVGAILAASGR